MEYSSSSLGLGAVKLWLFLLITMNNLVGFLPSAKYILTYYYITKGREDKMLNVILISLSLDLEFYRLENCKQNTNFLHRNEHAVPF